MEKQSKKLPIKHIIGYVTSVILTFVAIWAALGSNLPVMWIIISIFLLAIIQAAIQLFLFMHLIERGMGNAPWNMMFHGTIIFAILIAGSLFTMSFGFM
ncbi:cytochrome C oxidase subunit IV family protein [Lentibacillus sp. CBA3610]|uniref:cytochrome C oxidase subunit IV family protein n=1 Tax=Lentibacillus sp. CBA3610 TaxID=2518176 RepID=UPI0015958FD6|nr:cytochrome C oxidase subunit IV family protein [Lentibacillus sp. CBA3610]QKY68391.1 cytochrome aa3 quinol oxidase subunit IV [Lentibacillus sp. CBA3610]